MNQFNPIDILDPFDLECDIRQQFLLLYQQLRNGAIYITDLLKKCHAEDTAFQQKLDSLQPNEEFYECQETCIAMDPEIQASLKTFIEKWMTFYIHNYTPCREVHVLSLDPEHFGFDRNHKRLRVRQTLESHIFIEIARAKFLLARPRLLEEYDMIADSLEDEDQQGTTFDTPEKQRPVDALYSFSLTQDPMWISISNSFSVEYVIQRKQMIIDANKRADTKNDIPASAMKKKHEQEEIIVDDSVLEKQQELKTMWEKPILSFSQKEIINAVLFLGQQLRIVPEYTGPCSRRREEEHLPYETAYQEYQRIVRLVIIRCGELFSETFDDTVMDAPEFRHCVYQHREDFPPNDEYARKHAIDGKVPMYIGNRDFVTFLSFYIMEILRRFYHADILHHNTMDLRDYSLADAESVIHALAGTVKEFVTDMCKRIPSEALESIKMQASDIAYDFTCDKEYFEYQWPQKTYSINACLEAFRPHLLDAYISEIEVTERLLLDKTETNYVAQQFVLLMLNEHFKRHGLEWMDVIVLPSEMIETYARELAEDSRAPYILQVVSRFVAYDNGYIYQTNNLYETIAVWLYIFAIQYKFIFLEVDISGACKEIIGPKLFRALTTVNRESVVFVQEDEREQEEEEEEASFETLFEQSMIF